MKRDNKILLTCLGFVIVMLGVMCNDFVMAQNDGRMPVKNWDGVQGVDPTDLHSLLTKNTNYPYLADIINIGIGVFSIGDLITFSGVIVFYIGLIAKEEKN